MQRPDRRVSLIVDLNQVFTLRSVLKDLSTVHDVAGRVSAMRIALRTAGNNRVVCFTSSIIPREFYASVRHTTLELLLQGCQCHTFH